MITCHDSAISFMQFSQMQHIASLRHGLSLRTGLGETTKSVDFSTKTPESRRAGTAHGRLFCESLELSPEKLLRARQVHGDHVIVVTDAAQDIGECDGFCTELVDVGLMLLGADCPLILVVDPDRPAVGAAHAGWRGTVKRIARRLVETMQQAYGSRPERLLAGIGPGICGRCYEVGPEVIEEVRRALPFHNAILRNLENATDEAESHSTYLDLPLANKLELIECDVPEDRIETSGLCTFERTDLFYSYRREGAAAGRWALLTGLVNDC